MKYHFLFKEQESDIYSKGMNIYAPDIFDAILKFNELLPEIILLAIFTDKFQK